MPTQTVSQKDVSEFAADVRESLTKSGQRELPSKYLYDEVGSALFEAISVLPEYGLTRADARLLKTHAREIVGWCHRRYTLRSLEAAAEKRHAGYWRRFHGGRKRTTSLSKFRLPRWRPARKNWGRSIW